jgi:hypothetical protein
MPSISGIEMSAMIKSGRWAAAATIGLNHVPAIQSCR